jgi:hypothetical protein
VTYARKSLICLHDTPYYHVVSRCVRRAWLWGFDEYAGKDYSHRKTWVLDRLAELSRVFAIDICAYAVLADLRYRVCIFALWASRSSTHFLMSRSRSASASAVLGVHHAPVRSGLTVAARSKSRSDSSPTPGRIHVYGRRL